MVASDEVSVQKRLRSSGSSEPKAMGPKHTQILSGNVTSSVLQANHTASIDDHVNTEAHADDCNTTRSVNVSDPSGSFSLDMSNTLLSSKHMFALGSEDELQDSDPNNHYSPDAQKDDEGSDNFRDPGCLDDIEAELNEPPSASEDESCSNFEPRWSAIDDIKISQKFIWELQNATLKDYEADFNHNLQNPPTEQLTIEDPYHRLSLDIFLAVYNASEDAYASRLVEMMSGIVPITKDMCINFCIAYTGPFMELQCCPYCAEPRYVSETSSVPRQQFHTMPIGPQLQAIWRSPDGAQSMKYRQHCTEIILEELQRTGDEKISIYHDFFDGTDYLQAVLDDKIKIGDAVLILSIDGAQLYRNKISDTWIYIWIILDCEPSVRYKKKNVLPGGIIPGPNKPKNTDSFLFPRLHHLAVIQKEGLLIWDSSKADSPEAGVLLNITTPSSRNEDLESEFSPSTSLFICNPFLALVTADGPAQAMLSGCIGHHGKYGCHYFCPLKGRHKPGGTHYYAARLKPDNYSVSGCSHDDVDLRDLLTNFDAASCEQRYHKNLAWVVTSPNQTQYEARHLETGISKPSIFSSLPQDHMLPMLTCFPGDIMHLPCLNQMDLYLPLWRGKFECDIATNNRNLWHWAVLQGNVWKEHGKLVAEVTPWIPAWEYLLYFFGLSPTLLYGILPDDIWEYHCKNVRAWCIMLQDEILPEELREADMLFTEVSDGFEEIYIQRRTDRLHLGCQSGHTPSHLPQGTTHHGPPIIYSQWPMEQTIGNLTEEVKQHSNPFTNLAQRALRRCHINALKTILADLDPSNGNTSIPHNAIDLGKGYVLLPKIDPVQHDITASEERAIKLYLMQLGYVLGSTWHCSQVRRWARLRLPTGQNVRSLWIEQYKPLNRLRSSRHVKINLNGQHRFAETVALGQYATFHHQGDSAVHCVNIHDIESVVMMALDRRYGLHFQDGTQDSRWYMMERPNLRLAHMTGWSEEMDESQE
ncbi:hypothetical protein ARMSODRAFT_1068079 [Armillaria solidipes]|uniref:Uncharacterized protein n=1 Tax=Armillaria solidipes TaxID=1076256 RepID=A0A2H3BQQ8_9AGAR|nr:hypothetical protein ARMSODRAFT_1068079 [Armillaria solidipes]